MRPPSSARSRPLVHFSLFDIRVIISLTPRRTTGLHVFFDYSEMPKYAGDGLLATMANHIEQSAVVILCISEGYASSRFCKAEYTHAYSQEKPTFLMNVGEEGWSIPTTGDLGIMTGSGTKQYFFNRSEAEYKSDTGFTGLWTAMRCVPEIKAIRIARAPGNGGGNAPGGGGSG